MNLKSLNSIAKRARNNIALPITCLGLFGNIKRSGSTNNDSSLARVLA